MPRSKRIKIGLECTICGRRNYTLSKSKSATRGALVLRKHCPTCRAHTEHRESK